MHYGTSTLLQEEQYMAMGSTSSQSPVSEERQYASPYEPRQKLPLLSILLTLLAILALLHFTSSINMTYPLNAVNNCTQLILNNDYTKSIPRFTSSQHLTAVQLVNELTGGQPAA